MQNRQNIIEKLKQNLNVYREDSKKQLQNRLNYDPRKSLMKKTLEEKQKYNRDKKEYLDNRYNEAIFEVKKMKKTVLETQDVLEEDKHKVENMAKGVSLL